MRHNYYFFVYDVFNCEHFFINGKLGTLEKSKTGFALQLFAMFSSASSSSSHPANIASKPVSALVESAA